jgi:glutamyl-tRNA synthetase
VLDAAAAALDKVGDWNAESIMSALDGVASELELSRGKTFQPVRVAVTGTAVSPPLPQTLAVLDRTQVIERIRDARGMVVPAGDG